MLQQYGEPQMEVIFVLLEFRMAETLDILTWFSKTNRNKKQELCSSRIYLAREKKKMEKIERKKSESPMQVSFSVTEIV
jgi:hypothetical protein